MMANTSDSTVGLGRSQNAAPKAANPAFKMLGRASNDLLQDITNIIITQGYPESVLSCHLVIG